MSKKKYSICAVIGSYTDSDGQEKKRYQTVGAILENDNGPFIVMNKWFNPAGLASPSEESVFLSLFAPKEKSGETYADKARHIPPAGDDLADDIPF